MTLPELLAQLYAFDPMPMRCELNKRCTQQWEAIAHSLATEGHQDLAERWRVLGWDNLELFKNYATLLADSSNAQIPKRTLQ